MRGNQEAERRGRGGAGGGPSGAKPGSVLWRSIPGPGVGVAGAGSARRASGPQRQPGFAKEEPALCSQYLSRLMTVKTPYIQYPAERRLDSFFRWLFDSEIPRAIFGTYIGNLKAALLNK